MSLEELKAKAEKLGLSVSDDATEESLKSDISTKEQELENDIDFLKSEISKWKTEARKAFSKRDEFKRNRDTLSNQIKDLEGKMKNMIPSDEKTKLETELGDLRKFKSDIDKEKEEKEFENKTEVERLEMEMKKTKEGFQQQIDALTASNTEAKKKAEKQLEDTKKEAEILRESKLEAEIIREASNLNAWNASQIFYLIKDRFKYDKNLGKFTHQIRDEKGKLADELSVKEYVEDFLGREENENLIKSNINTSSLKTDKDKNVHKSSTGDLENYNPKDPSIMDAAETEVMSPEDYIRLVLIPQKKKFQARYRNAS